jgi:hypothetical protein
MNAFFESQLKLSNQNESEKAETKRRGKMVLTLHPKELLQHLMYHSHNQNQPLPCCSHPQMNSLPDIVL